MAFTDTDVALVLPLPVWRLCGTAASGQLRLDSRDRLRDECLNLHRFWSLTLARVTISDWKTEYNHHRRHSALGYQAPARYAEACTHQ